MALVVLTMLLAFLGPNIVRGHDSYQPPYLMQDYQLGMVTERGDYCRTVAVNHIAAIFCDSKTPSDTTSINIVMQNPLAVLTNGEGIDINLRPGTGYPLSVQADGLVVSTPGNPRAHGQATQTRWMFYLEAKPGRKNVPLLFDRNGSRPLYWVANVTTFSPDGTVKAAVKYCRVGRYKSTDTTTGNVTVYPAALLCDVLQPTSATRIKLQPAGMSWGRHRLVLQNEATGLPCGNMWYQKNATFVTCDNGTNADLSGLEWRDDMSVFVFKSYQLPMRTSAEFMMQTWIEYNIPMAYWMTSLGGYVMSSYFTTSSDKSRVLPGTIPYFTLVKAEGRSSNSTIVAGSRVLLRSSRKNKYCGVFGDLAQIRCNASWYHVVQTKDRTPYYFTYDELSTSSSM